MALERLSQPTFFLILSYGRPNFVTNNEAFFQTPLAEEYFWKTKLIRCLTPLLTPGEMGAFLRGTSRYKTYQQQYHDYFPFTASGSEFHLFASYFLLDRGEDFIKECRESILRQINISELKSYQRFYIIGMLNTILSKSTPYGLNFCLNLFPDGGISYIASLLSSHIVNPSLENVKYLVERYPPTTIWPLLGKSLSLRPHRDEDFLKYLLSHYDPQTNFLITFLKRQRNLKDIQAIFDNLSSNEVRGILVETTDYFEHNNRKFGFLVERYSEYYLPQTLGCKDPYRSPTIKYLSEKGFLGFLDVKSQLRLAVTGNLRSLLEALIPLVTPEEVIESNLLTLVVDSKSYHLCDFVWKQYDSYITDEIFKEILSRIGGFAKGREAEMLRILRSLPLRTSKQQEEAFELIHPATISKMRIRKNL